MAFQPKPSARTGQRITYTFPGLPYTSGNVVRQPHAVLAVLWPFSTGTSQGSLQLACIGFGHGKCDQYSLRGGKQGTQGGGGRQEAKKSWSYRGKPWYACVFDLGMPGKGDGERSRCDGEEEEREG